MIIAAALLASGQVLPWIDRSWLNEQARLEAAASTKQTRALKQRPNSPQRPSAKNAREVGYENSVIGM
jgi:hypothetical protein